MPWLWTELNKSPRRIFVKHRGFCTDSAGANSLVIPSSWRLEVLVDVGGRVCAGQLLSAAGGCFFSAVTCKLFFRLFSLIF